MRDELSSESSRRRLIAASLLVSLALLCCSDEDAPLPPKHEPVVPVCEKTSLPLDDHTPTSHVDDWGDPVRLGSPVNTLCPQDAIEIDTTTGYLYVMYTEDVLDSLTPAKMLAPENNTYRLKIIQLPDQFGEPEYFDLTLGAAGSLDGELSFDHAHGRVYFHSARAENLGYTVQPPEDDFIDIYCATLAGGKPDSLKHLPPPVNSIYPDGEHAIHPDGARLYFASLRPGGLGKADIYVSTFGGSTWSTPENSGAPINSPGEDKQPSLTPDGKYLYFVHVLTSGNLPYDADVWYSVRK
jgi:hypothetical protein